MATNRFHFLALPIAIASVALTACGGGDSPGASGGTEADFRESALKFARCMREQGIDMPDPTFGAGGKVAIEVRGDPGGKLAMERAEKACRKYQPRPRTLSPEDEREFRERALRHARCMREHGIDMPDPTFGEGGGVEMRMGGDVGPGNPRFDEAQRKCSKYGPKFGLTRKAG
jgi:hypothetical protein